MTAWTLRFGPSPARLAWVVQREDGISPLATFQPDVYEAARRVVREVLDR